MSDMKVVICGEERSLPEGTTLAQAIEMYSPYGEEAVICRLNGRSVRSIDESIAEALNDGDVLEIYPLIIGG